MSFKGLQPEARQSAFVKLHSASTRAAEYRNTWCCCNYFHVSDDRTRPAEVHCLNAQARLFTFPTITLSNYHSYLSFLVPPKAAKDCGWLSAGLLWRQALVAAPRRQSPTKACLLVSKLLCWCLTNLFDGKRVWNSYLQENLN